MHIPRMFCMQCVCEMTILKTGVKLEVQLDSGEPYYIVSSDHHQCPECLIIVAEPARAVIVSPHEEGWENYLGDMIVKLKR